MNNEIRDMVHNVALKSGWWGGSEFPTPDTRITSAMMLVVTELAEAAEGFRKDLDDDHLPHHKMFDVELADAAIRLLDIAGALDIDCDIDTRLVWIARNDITRAYNRNQLEHLFYITTKLTDRTHGTHSCVRNSLAAIQAVAAMNGIDLDLIIVEKSRYNETRADHKPENRDKPGGKKY